MDIARLMGKLSDAVLVARFEAPTFDLRDDLPVLKLRADEWPDAVRWPVPSGIDVRAVTDGMIPADAYQLVAVQLGAGAAALHEYDVANTELYWVRTHAGVRP